MRYHAAALFVACILTLLVADRPQRPSHGSDATAARAAQSPQDAEREREGRAGAVRSSLQPGVEFVFRQRLYGSGNVNIDERRHSAWSSVCSAVAKDAAVAKGATVAKGAAAAAWLPLGPDNIAGRIRALAFNPADPRVLYAGAASGGVMKSTDGGAIWRPMTDAAPALPVGAIAVDARNPSIVYAGTGEAVVALSKAITMPAYSGVGVLKSTDAGETWSQLPWPSASSAVTRLIIHPASSDTILAATRSNLLRSVDGGASWQSNVLSGVISDIRYKEDDPAVVFAAVGFDFGDPANGVYRSTNGGARFSWTRVSAAFPSPDSIGRVLLATSPAAPGRIYALLAKPIRATATPAGTAYAVTDRDFLALMRSTDAGEHWERMATTLPADFALGQAFYDLAIAVSPTNPDLLFAGGLEMYKSVDGGVTFWKISYGNLPLHLDQHTILFQPGTGHVYVGNDGGVYRSTNEGSNWDFLGATLETAQFYSVASDRINAGRFFGGTQDNGTLRSSLPARAWLTLRGDLDGGAIAVDSNTIYSMGTLSIYPNRSTNGGQSWSILSEGFRSDNRPNWLQPLILHPTDRSRIYTATQFVYEARDANSTTANPVWRVVSPDLTGQGTVYESVVTTIAVAPSSGNWVYAGTGDGRVQRCSDVSLAVPVWTDISQGVPNRWITRVAVHPADHRIVYCSLSGYGSGHVLKSTDAGDHWTDISGDLPDIPVNAVLVAPQQPGVVFLATDLGVWMSKDDLHWESFGRGLPNVVVYDLVVDPSNRLVAATYGRGMWMTDASVAIESPPMQCGFSIAGHFPDPLRGDAARLTVLVDNPAVARITLTVHDASGRRISRQVHESVSPGRQMLVVALPACPAGIYFYRVERGGTSNSRKFLFVR